MICGVHIASIGETKRPAAEPLLPAEALSPLCPAAEEEMRSERERERGKKRVESSDDAHK